MKKIYLLSVITAFVIAIITLKSSEVNSAPKPLKSTGPQLCVSGEAPNFSNCTTAGCHEDNVVNSGSASVSLDLGDKGEGFYVPNQTYTISINIAKANMLRAGFQIIAVQDDSVDYSPGTVTLSNAAETQKLSSNTACNAKFKTWVEHTYAGTDVDETGSKTWTYQWKAPSKNAGNITFYLAALEANDDQDNSGDYTYTITKTLSYKQPEGIVDALLNNNLSIYPNPSTNELTIKYNNAVTLSSLDILNQAGTVVKTYKISSFNQTVTGTQTFDIQDLTAGVYFLKAHSELGSIIKKVVILK